MKEFSKLTESGVSFYDNKITEEVIEIALTEFLKWFQITMKKIQLNDN